MSLLRLVLSSYWLLVVLYPSLLMAAWLMLI